MPTFSPFPIMFSKGFSSWSLKVGIVWYIVNSQWSNTGPSRPSYSECGFLIIFYRRPISWQYHWYMCCRIHFCSFAGICHLYLSKVSIYNFCYLCSSFYCYGCLSGQYRSRSDCIQHTVWSLIYITCITETQETEENT